MGGVLEACANDIGFLLDATLTRKVIEMTTGAEWE
jgi:hypothetical protein